MYTPYYYGKTALFQKIPRSGKQRRQMVPQGYFRDAKVIIIYILSSTKTYVYTPLAIPFPTNAHLHKHIEQRVPNKSLFCCAHTVLFVYMDGRQEKVKWKLFSMFVCYIVICVCIRFTHSHERVCSLSRIYTKYYTVSFTQE